MNEKKYDLEDRLVDFACMCLDICELLPTTRSGQTLQSQLARSGTAPALIYGEAQAAESRADFIHKMKVILKEIRETSINLKIIIKKPILVHEKVGLTYKEAGELMAIFLKSINTAKMNDEKSRK
jgi:four helix bundle protein